MSAASLLIFCSSFLRSAFCLAVSCSVNWCWLWYFSNNSAPSLSSRLWLGVVFTNFSAEVAFSFIDRRFHLLLRLLAACLAVGLRRHAVAVDIIIAFAQRLFHISIQRKTRNNRIAT